MKKSYTNPEFSVLKFDVEDIIQESAAPVLPKTMIDGTKAASYGTQSFDIFE